MPASTKRHFAAVCALQKAHHFVKQLQTLPGLHQKLTEGVKVADVGCG